MLIFSKIKFLVYTKLDPLYVYSQVYNFYLFFSSSFSFSTFFFLYDLKPHISHIHNFFLKKSFLTLKLLSKTFINEKCEVPSDTLPYNVTKIFIIVLDYFSNIIEFLCSEYSEYHLASKMCVKWSLVFSFHRTVELHHGINVVYSNILIYILYIFIFQECWPDF